MFFVSFLRFKKRAVLNAFIKSLCFALAIGISTGAVFFILIKREVIALDFWFSLLFGFSASALSFLLLFLILRPRNKRFARRLDDEFSLDERVVTMLELDGTDNPIAELQREDTERRLSGIPTSSLRFGRVWVMIVCAIISLALLTTSLIVPVASAPPPEDEIVDEYEKNWRVASLRALIERVEKDQYADEGLKTSLITIIEELIEVVIATDKEAVMKTGAVAAVNSVEGVRLVFSSAIAYANVMKLSDNTDFVALGRALGEFDDIAFGDKLTSIANGFTEPIDESVSSFLDVFRTFVTEVGMPEGDALTAKLTGFITNLRAAVDDGADKGEVKDIVEELNYSLFDCLLLQSDNNKLALIVRTEIMSLFSLTAADFEANGEDMPNINDDTPTGDDDKEEDITPGAGYGKGDKIVGTNDSLYDHEKGELVPLPDVLNKYYNMFDEIMDNIDPELKAQVEEYFNILKKPVN